jgi:tRNA threonylcarbamoyladenosine biosynthesis protein TsaB
LVILCLDTATDVATVCVSVDGRVAGEAWSRGRAAGQHVLEHVDSALESAGLDVSDVERIVVGRGPGTFTGLRIGLATARGLGFALGVPVCGVSTLDALRHGDGVEAACIDARRGEVFASGGGLEPWVGAPAMLAELLRPGTSLAGDGAVLYREVLAAATIAPDDSPVHVPWARHHAALVAQAGPPDPVYLREPDAVRNIRQGVVA